MNTHELAKILLQMPNRAVDDSICCGILVNDESENYEAAISMATVDEGGTHFSVIDTTSSIYPVVRKHILEFI